MKNPPGLSHVGGAEGMAAPRTAPERFVMVGADSDAAFPGGAPNVPKGYGRAERAGSFRISRAVAERPRPPLPNDRIRFRREAGAPIYSGVAGSGIQGSQGSGFRGFKRSGSAGAQWFTGDSRFSVESGEP